MSEEIRCSKCTFWTELKPKKGVVEPDHGMCQRYPPEYVNTARNGLPIFLSPSTYKGYWCGEFTRSKSDG